MLFSRFSSAKGQDVSSWIRQGLSSCCTAAIKCLHSDRLLCMYIFCANWLLRQKPITLTQQLSLCVRLPVQNPLLDNWVAFFLSGSPPIQNWSPNQNLGTPSVGSQNGPLKPPPTYLGLDVLNLQILRIEDVPGMSTSSIMPFHKNVDPKLVHRLSQGQQTWAHGLFFVEYRNSP